MNPSGMALKLGMRESALAHQQADTAIMHLSELIPDANFEKLPISSPGDRDRELDLRESPSDFFTRDLDEAVLAGDVDCAIHSAKDLPEPTALGIDWCWLPWREDGRDVLVVAAGHDLGRLPEAPIVGVSSERRASFAEARFPNAQCQTVRGSIEERLEKLDRGQFDVLIMAAAALLRLGLEHRISKWISLADLETPEGQGALAMTFQEGDERFLRLRSLFVMAVIFAGAGAGRAGECTLWAKRALQRADVCLYDALLDPALLEYLPRCAQRIDVGKRCARTSPAQEEINTQIATFARRGCRVVRLKGGDPGIFGRLADEADALDALHLPYRVIPGVSSLTTATTGTGMLLTRRGLSRGFTVMTPRLRGGKTAPVNAESRAEFPLVFFMAMSSLQEVVDELLQDGVSADMPSAVVFGAGTDEELIIDGPLESIASSVAAAKEGPQGLQADQPGLLLVGKVTCYRFSSHLGALEGCRVLLTGSDALQDKSADTVHDFGGIPVQRPLIRLVTCAEAERELLNLSEYEWLVLTSPSAVRCCMELMRENMADVRRFPKLIVAGAGTARELSSYGLHANLQPEGKYSTRSVIEKAKSVISDGTRILRLRSDKAGRSLAEAMEKLGAEVTDCILYRNERIHYARLPGFDIVFFASTSAVEAFNASWGTNALAGKVVVAIGQPTVDALEKEGITVDLVGPEATVNACLTALAEKMVRERLARSHEI